MKVLVTGYNGQLGFDVCKCLAHQGIEHLGAGVHDFDLSDATAVTRFVMDYQPSVVIHCAAYTAVDRAEDEKDVCHKVNVEGTQTIANCCKKLGAKMVYISTDYVFDGSGETPFEVDSPANPINQYGLTKYQGEQVVAQTLHEHFIVRTSWVFGVNGQNFVKTMLRLGQERSELGVIADQVGSPTYTPDLAKLIVEMIQTEHYGTYHATNEGFCSWYEFALAIFSEVNQEIKVNALTSLQYPTKAIRPLNSRLSKDKLVEKGFTRLPDWQDALHRYLLELAASQAK